MSDETEARIESIETKLNELIDLVKKNQSTPKVENHTHHHYPTYPTYTYSPQWTPTTPSWTPNITSTVPGGTTTSFTAAGNTTSNGPVGGPFNDSSTT